MSVCLVMQSASRFWPFSGLLCSCLTELMQVFPSLQSKCSMTTKVDVSVPFEYQTRFSWPGFFFESIFNLGAVISGDIWTGVGELPAIWTQKPLCGFPLFLHWTRRAPIPPTPPFIWHPYVPLPPLYNPPSMPNTYRLLCDWVLFLIGKQDSKTQHRLSSDFAFSICNYKRFLFTKIIKHFFSTKNFRHIVFELIWIFFFWSGRYQEPFLMDRELLKSFFSGRGWGPPTPFLQQCPYSLFWTSFFRPQKNCSAFVPSMKKKHVVCIFTSWVFMVNFPRETIADSIPFYATFFLLPEKDKLGWHFFCSETSGRTGDPPPSPALSASRAGERGPCPYPIPHAFVPVEPREGARPSARHATRCPQMRWKILRGVSISHSKMSPQYGSSCGVIGS